MPIFYGNVKENIDVFFLVSSTLELVSSLHVISDPTHHTNSLYWNEEVNQKLNPDLIRRIKDFGGKYASWSLVMDIIDSLIDLDIPHQNEKDDFNRIYSLLELLDRIDFAEIFLGTTLIDPVVFEEIIKYPKHLENYKTLDLYKYMSMRDAIYFLENIESVKTEMLDLMSTYHSLYFEHHWKMTKDDYMGVLTREKRKFQGTDPLDYVLNLHRDLTFEGNSIVMKKEMEFVVDTQTVERVKLYCSLYTFPHLMMNMYGNTLSFYKNILLPQRFNTCTELSNRIKAFSDVNRLSIMKILLKNHCSNKELAEVLDISPASVSQHLKILKDLNLITGERQKNNIFYRASRKELEKSLLEVADFLGIDLL